MDNHLMSYFADYTIPGREYLKEGTQDDTIKYLASDQYALDILLTLFDKEGPLSNREVSRVYGMRSLQSLSGLEERELIIRNIITLASDGKDKRTSLESSLTPRGKSVARHVLSKI